MTARRVLRDGDGRALAEYVEGVRSGRPWADALTVLEGTGIDAVVEAVRARLGGWLVSSSDEIGLRLVADGAIKFRHAHVYTWDLSASPPDGAWAEPKLVDGLTLVPAHEREPADLVGAWMTAYRPGHPDNPNGVTRETAREQLATLINGISLGPLLPCSVVIQDGARPVAACLVNGRQGEPPLGGPWIAEVFRDADPAYAGLGTVALKAAVGRAARDGLASVGLAVTEGNPARATYEKAGFVHAESSTTVLIPERRRDSAE
ncbi:GNAT family N-acetyltransferase [Yinghuangia seranimata]|uniref:GNAT family N-acetyltransferase n=1 Tax=Yinghuangia seranimata TaxID=408067 RepID=UPI00248ACD1B|nr:GNAT family N-acetyltransferase [Yinghuangia seranimata]MDI2130639.1 GNAT family N-acetyltransferase [Yinghuangia seranimata]